MVWWGAVCFVVTASATHPGVCCLLPSSTTCCVVKCLAPPNQVCNVPLVWLRCGVRLVRLRVSCTIYTVQCYHWYFFIGVAVLWGRLVRFSTVQYGWSG